MFLSVYSVLDLDFTLLSFILGNLLYEVNL